MMTRRSAFAVWAVALFAPVAAYAQAGGLPSSTAPSNSEGTPSGGTGVVGRSRVEPTAAAPARRRRRNRHRNRAARQ